MPTGPKKIEPKDHNAPARGTTKERGYGSDWQKVRLYKLSQNPICEFRFPNICTGWAEHVHHVIPLSQGGTHDLKNLKASCMNCHMHHHKNPSDSR